ncbi:Ankyrin repeat-containing protein P16F5.05c [Diplonema papillatum]|nr:Ankyrin repeat-containing protein P16F5.05c [Diplonema papillatum]
MSAPEEAEVSLSEYPREELVGELIQAARYGEQEDVDLLRRLLVHDTTLAAETDDQGRTAAHMCCANGKDNILKVILENSKPDPAAVNNEGNTALHYAAFNGSIECVKLLLAAGYDVMARNKNNKKPIDECWGKGFDKVEDMLLLKDTDVDAELAKREEKVTDKDIRDVEQVEKPAPKATASPSRPAEAEETAGSAKKEQKSMMTME